MNTTEAPTSAQPSLDLKRVDPTIHLLGQIVLDQLLKIPSDLVTLKLALGGLETAKLSDNLARQAIIDLHTVGLMEYYRLAELHMGQRGMSEKHAKRVDNFSKANLHLEVMQDSGANYISSFMTECHHANLGSAFRERWLTEFFQSRGVTPPESEL